MIWMREPWQIGSNVRDGTVRKSIKTKSNKASLIPSRLKLMRYESKPEE